MVFDVFLMATGRGIEAANRNVVRGERVTDQNETLNIGAWQERSMVNGPGERFVLWLQGCRLKCPGCFNPEFQPIVIRELVDPKRLAQCVTMIPGIEGLTYTGGEPMLQAHPLAILSEAVRERGLSVVCYTGYTLEQLHSKNDPWIERLLTATDVLIDGPYVIEEAANLLWRGSKNQRIHFLSERYREWGDRPDFEATQVEFSVGDKEFVTTGVWPDELLERLKDLLGR